MSVFRAVENRAAVARSANLRHLLDHRPARTSHPERVWGGARAPAAPRPTGSSPATSRWVRPEPFTPGTATSYRLGLPGRLAGHPGPCVRSVDGGQPAWGPRSPGQRHPGVEAPLGRRDRAEYGPWPPTPGPRTRRSMKPRGGAPSPPNHPRLSASHLVALRSSPSHDHEPARLLRAGAGVRPREREVSGHRQPLERPAVRRLSDERAHGAWQRRPLRLDRHAGRAAVTATRSSPPTDSRSPR